jgi:hypothetical protein
MRVISKDVITGEVTERDYTQDELDDIADNIFMSKLLKKIYHLYPTALLADVSLANQGSGVEITYWNTVKLGAEPTIAQLDSLVTDAEIESCQRWKIIRNERDKLLKESDYLILADAPITTEKKEEWETYRQALRDIPQDYDSPDEVVYPDKPE